MSVGDGGSESGLGGVERVVGAGTPLSVGRFRFWFADQRWEWSDEVARMHGHRPGEVEPSTALLLAHKHPEDRDRVESALVTSVHEDTPFSSSHRIIDTAGAVHQVIVVSDPLHDEAGTVIGTTGFYVDLTDHPVENLTGIATDGTDPDGRPEVALEDVLPELLAARAVIEQAKGALMVVYGINAEQAFRVLRWRSQDTNLKLRVVAQRLVEGLVALPAAEASTRSRLDHLVLTLHQDPQPEPC
ncbi:PAS and ANTAR domain-containing protein [Nocardia sp. NPDC057030]|uniref:PAS and ANTAR domain-containing protein n=1 Tax=unclassified Nocardia TaxID=2637762 RepID=UPI00363604D2